jgi:hypothetical protein
MEQLEQQMGGISLGPTTNEERTLDGLANGFAEMKIK